MTTLAEPSEFQRRFHELEIETRRDKARFAAWVLAVLLAIAGSFAMAMAGQA
jgi:hypothetical protein